MLGETQSKSKTNENEQIKYNKSLMRPQGEALKHPFAEELSRYATNGCPVDCGPNWTRERIEAAIAVGPSPSALLPEHIE